MYDIAVIGLGPAGATLARLLDARFSVLALDRRQAGGGGDAGLRKPIDEAGRATLIPLDRLSAERGKPIGGSDHEFRKPDDGGGREFRKPCGGLLAPDAQKALARFGLTLPVEVLVDPQIFSVRTIDLASGRTRRYPRFYLNMDRHAFDQWLISLIPGHVDVRAGVRVVSIQALNGKDSTGIEGAGAAGGAVEAGNVGGAVHTGSLADAAYSVHTGDTGVGRGSAGYRITWKQAGETHTAEARRIVGADGANSLVRRSLYPDAACRAYTAIQQWFTDDHATPFYSCLFDQESTNCCAWGLSKNGYFLFGGAFAPAEARTGFARMKSKAAAHGFTLEQPIRTEACMVLRPQNPWSMHTGRGDAFLVGEAAGFISPSSLEGLSYAFAGARILGRVLNSRRKRPDLWYFLLTLPLRCKLSLKMLKSFFIYSPFLRKILMKSGIGSISVEERP